MVDATVREHERRWRETGAPDDQVRWLVARLRAGELTPERLELAACLGSRAARAALDGRVRAWDPPTDDPRAWLMALVAWGDEVLVRGLALALGSFDPSPWGAAFWPTLELVLAWCDEPTAERAHDAASSKHAQRLAVVDEPHLRLGADLAQAVAAPAGTRQKALALSLAPEALADASLWLAFEARRLLREWALDLPEELRTTLPSIFEPRVLERALARAAPLPRPTGLRGWLAGDPPAPRVERVVPLAGSEWLRHQRVLDVYASGADLLHVSLPGATIHRGLVLQDAESRVRPLDQRHPEHFDLLLEGEGVLPEEVEAADLAALVGEALLAGRNDCVRVIGNAADLARPGYVVDPRPASIYLDRLAPPRLERRQGGWTLRFTCLSGWMHETQRLAAVTIVKSAGRPTQVEQQLLCERVYSQVPQIMY